MKIINGSFNAWIDPKGKIHVIPPGRTHARHAESLGENFYDLMERGWIRLVWYPMHGGIRIVECRDLIESLPALQKALRPYYEAQGDKNVHIEDKNGEETVPLSTLALGSSEEVLRGVANNPPKFNAAFWKWFGESKVVDASGQPLVVYHGTPDSRDIFKSGFKAFSRGSAFFAVSDISVAATYASGKTPFDYQNAEPAVIPLYLSIQNPMIVDAKGRSWRDTEKHVSEAKENGHDGIIIYNSVDVYQKPLKGKAKSSDVYVWFSPFQAKSALDAPIMSKFKKLTPDGRSFMPHLEPIDESGANDGTWDADDSNIRSNPGRPLPPADKLEHQAMQIILGEKREMTVDVDKINLGGYYRYFVEAKFRGDNHRYDCGNFSQYDDALRQKVRVYNGEYLVSWGLG